MTLTPGRRYGSKRPSSNTQGFRAHTFARLNKILLGGTQLRVLQMFTGGYWAVVEFRSMATATSGMRCHNRYGWVMQF